MVSDQECGEKWRASFTKYDPDSRLWRTHQCSLLGDLEPFSETWPQWGLMRDGECWEQRTLEQTIRGTESGLSPNGVDSFHTPNCTGLDGGSNSRKALKKRAEMWPTPRSCSAMAANITPGSAWDDKRNPNLETIVGRRMWPTPTAHDAKDTGTAPSEGKRNTPNLAYQAKNWPTPRTKGMCGGTGSWELLKKNTTIEEARAMGAGNGGKLNPMWVEWLMGWPLGWTDLKPLETGKSHCVQQQHGES